MMKRTDMHNLWKNLRLQGRETGICGKLLIYWTFLLISFLLVLILILNLTGILSTSSSKLAESLQLQQANTYETLFHHFDQATAHCTHLSQRISQDVAGFLTQRGKTFQDLNNDQELIRDLELQLYPHVDDTLATGLCSGAFVILDATVNTEAEHADTSRMSIYIRLSDLNTTRAAKQNKVIYRGSPDIARREKMNLHNRWNLESDTAYIPGMSGLPEMLSGRLSEYTRLTYRMILPGTWENVVLLYSPVTDTSGRMIGICGVDISELFFRLSYKATETAYGSMFTVLAPRGNGQLQIGKGLVGETNTQIKDLETLDLRPGEGYSIYGCNLGDYLGVERETSFRTEKGEPLYMTTLVSARDYAQYEKRININMLIILLVLVLLITGLSLYFAMHATRSFQRSLELVREGRNAIERTGIRELDELLETVIEARGSADADGSVLPSRVDELLSEFVERIQTLTPMEHMVLQSYIDGCSIRETAERAFISINTVRKHNSHINSKLGVSSHEELCLYIEIFRRADKLKEITRSGTYN